MNTKTVVDAGVSTVAAIEHQFTACGRSHRTGTSRAMYLVAAAKDLILIQTVGAPTSGSPGAYLLAPTPMQW